MIPVTGSSIFPWFPIISRDAARWQASMRRCFRNTCSLYIMLACDLPNLQAPLSAQTWFRSPRALMPQFHAQTMDWPILCAPSTAELAFPSIEKALQQGANKVIETFLDDTLTVRWVGPDEGMFGDSDLANINTPEDLRKLRVCLRPSRSQP